MVFSSILFLFYFLPIFLLLYHIVSKSYKNYVILLASIIFYAWGAPEFIYLALVSIVADFFLVKYINKLEKQKSKWLLWASILLNVGMLLYFKYSNFFIENVNHLLSRISVSQVKWTELLLPIGISFFTFQKISYAVDVYRGTNKPLNKLTDYMVYILLFPQLIAGPIVRFKEIADQLINRDNNNYNDKIYGIYRFCIGLAKKVLIANVLGAKADIVFTMDIVDLNSSLAWFGIVCYTFQIYFDFSGYSDMAIGLGKLMGFKFPENFNSPYTSQSITEFWRRWHITLGSWMRDYIYIPLGGNRVNSISRLYLNLWLVFLISGLWHGASWNFILWGAYHGLFIVCDKLFLVKLVSKIGKPLRIIFTFLIVLFGWVLFRANNLAHALEFYQAMLDFKFETIRLILDNEVIYILLLAIVLSFTLSIKKIEKSYLKFSQSTSLKVNISKSILSYLLLILSTASLVASDFNPFIYFRF